MIKCLHSQSIYPIHPKIWVFTPILMLRFYTTLSLKIPKDKQHLRRLYPKLLPPPELSSLSHITSTTQNNSSSRNSHIISSDISYTHTSNPSHKTLPTYLQTSTYSNPNTLSSIYSYTPASKRSYISSSKILTTQSINHPLIPHTFSYKTITNKSAIPLSFTIHINDEENKEYSRQTFKPDNSDNYDDAKEIISNIDEFYNYEPVIMLHGLLGAKRNFNSFARLIKSKIVIVMDLRNHGDSHHSHKTSINDMVDDLVHFLDSLIIPKCVIVGHSLGGKVAMGAALSHPEKITKLISLDMPNSKFELTGENASKSARFVWDVITSVSNLFDSEEAFYESRNHIKDRIRELIPNISMEMLSFLLQNVREKSNGRWDWTINMKAIHQSLENNLFDWPYQNNLITYDKPSLFIRGEKSNYILDKHKPKILQQFPSAHFNTVLNAGHWIHSEKPIETAIAINEFLGIA